MDSFVFKKVDVRKRVYSVLRRMKKTDVVKHFQTEGVPRRTIYNIIKSYEGGIPCEDKPRQGRPAKLNKRQLRKLKDSARKSCWNQSKKAGKEIQGLTIMYSTKFKENWFKILQKTACTKIQSKTTRTNSSKVSKITPRIYRSRNFHHC